MKRLNNSKSAGKVPTGLIVHFINDQPLQDCFDTYLWDAKLKFLDATIKALVQDEPHYKERCANEKKKVAATGDA